MKTSLLLLVAGAATALFGLPSVTDVAVTADTTARRVTVSYVLADGPAIVTAEFLTNGVPVDAAAGACVYGDVNRKVASDGAHAFTWLADHSGFNARLDGVDVTARVTAWDVACPPDYLAVGVEAPHDVRFFTSTNALPGGLAHADWRTRYILMRKIPAAGARRRLGCMRGENGVAALNGAYNTTHRETPRMVTFTNDFWMGVFPVTQGQWKRCWTSENMQSSCPSAFADRADADLRPVDNMVYTDIRPDTWPADGHAFTDGWIGRLRRLTGVAFDLPTDAQWEFACRAGGDTALYSGKGVTTPDGEDAEVGRIGWYEKNAGETKPVGLKAPNAWGLYDMLGNVWESVLDLAADGSVSISGDESVEPTGPASASPRMRCKRGGGWRSTARQCRCAMRGAEVPTFKRNDSGFRLMAPIGLVW